MIKMKAIEISTTIAGIVTKGTLEFKLYDVNKLPSLSKVIGEYIMFDINEQVLYVGESESVGSRYSDHKGTKDFIGEVAYLGVYTDKSLADANKRKAVESQLIVTLNPKYNCKKFGRKRKGEKTSEELQRQLRTNRINKDDGVSKELFYEIQDLLKKGARQVDLAKKYKLHRNTLSNIKNVSTSKFAQWELERREATKKLLKHLS